MVIATKKKRIYEVAALARSAKLDVPTSSNPQSSVAFQAAREYKKVKIDESNPEHTIIIGARLEEK